MLKRYVAAATAMDRRLAVLVAVLPHGWMLGALALLSLNHDSSRTGFAVAFGGILLGYEALQRIVLSGSQLADAVVAGAHVRPYLRAAAQPVDEPMLVPSAPAQLAPAPILAANDLRFSHKTRVEAVIDGCDVSVDPSARIVLDGDSGAGKSTLAAVLAGARTPEQGTRLLGGEPFAAVGAEEWRRRVSLSPQFHENHLLLGSFAFNVLMGRGWPASPDDLEEAWTVCQQLGLGPLLDRMPSGFAEMVGDTGWQLSQGERSLVFVARSLLQRADVVFLDESFGSLDPQTMQTALDAVIARAPALVVIRQ
jgi:ATP-binding cassette subfamily B protein